MDYMLDPPDDDPEPSQAEIDAAEERIITAFYADPIVLLEEIEADALLDAFCDFRAGDEAAAANGIRRIITEMERILFSPDRINAELQRMSEEARDDVDVPDPDDYMIDEAAAFGGRHYPP
jgi:hypothetical protein